MFNIGFGELVLIAVVLIIVVGPERLPTLLRSVGRTVRGVRQASNELRASVGLDELLNQDALAPDFKSRRNRKSPKESSPVQSPASPAESPPAGKAEEHGATPDAEPHPESDREPPGGGAKESN